MPPSLYGCERDEREYSAPSKSWRRNGHNAGGSSTSCTRSDEERTKRDHDSRSKRWQRHIEGTQPSFHNSGRAQANLILRRHLGTEMDEVLVDRQSSTIGSNVNKTRQGHTSRSGRGPI
eukprot:scaffold3344_cov2724-Pavlova_lutheri.AAC.1